MKDVCGATEWGQRQAVLSLRQMKIAKQWAFWDSFVFIVFSGWLCPGPSHEVPTLQRAIVALAYLKQRLCGLLCGLPESWARAQLCISSDNEETVTLATALSKVGQTETGSGTDRGGLLLTLYDVTLPYRHGSLTHG